MLKVLLLCDDLWHPADIIERALSIMDREDIDFDIVKTAKDILTPAMLTEYPVIMSAKANAVNAANSAPWFEDGVTECSTEDIRDYVKNGGGFVAVHAATSIERGVLPVYNEMLGSYFLSHPPRRTVYVTPSAQHPITEGVGSFSAPDEYYQIAITAQDTQNFLESKSENGGTFVSGYAREYGKGRVAVITPGHTFSMWKNPGYQRLIKNALRWCAKW